MAILAKEKILTLDYWKPASQIEVGDYLFDLKGNPVKVTSIQTYMASKCYTVTLNDMITISGDAKMMLPLETPKYRNRLQTYKGKKQFRRPLKQMSLADIEKHPLKTKWDRSMLSVPTCNPLKFPTQDLLVPPFIFGLWFRNITAHGKYSAKEVHLDYLKEKIQDCGYEMVLRQARKDKASRFFSIFPSVESHLAPNVPNKIPTNYLLSSEEQRLELLRGLVMGRVRQFNKAKQRFKISLGSWHDIHQIQGLIESLGIKTLLHHEEYIERYVLTFRTKHLIHPDQTPKPIKVHQTRRYIRSIEEIQPQLCVHIETDGEDGTFLAGEGFISCR